MGKSAYHVTFEGLQHAGGLYNSYAFQITSPGDSQPQALSVHVSTSLQIRLWQEHDAEHAAVMGMAARAVRLHLTGAVPPEAYREGDPPTLLLNTNWYPGHPGQPELEENFESFEVTGTDEADAPDASPDGGAG